MKIVAYYLLPFLSLVGCQTPSYNDIARFNNRPNVLDPCIANGDGTCFRNGELQDNKNNICGDSLDYDNLQKHIEFLERYRYNCIKFGACD